jgi:hypothetical protein
MAKDEAMLKAETQLAEKLSSLLEDMENELDPDAMEDMRNYGDPESSSTIEQVLEELRDAHSTLLETATRIDGILVFISDNKITGSPGDVESDEVKDKEPEAE